MKRALPIDRTSRRFACASFSITLLVVSVLAVASLDRHAGAAPRQDAVGDGSRTLEDAAADLERRLEEALGELERVRDAIREEVIPLSGELSDLERELLDVRAEYDEVARTLDTRRLDVANLKGEIKEREIEAQYLENLLGQYIRNFEVRIHIAERQRYQDAIEAAKLAPGNSNLSDGEQFAEQASMIATALERLEEALGGTRFDGSAVAPVITDDVETSLVRKGTFLLLGPAALFRSGDGAAVGIIEERLDSQEPTVVPFGDDSDTVLAGELVAGGSGFFPFDVTLGNAHKVETTEETFLEHVRKGGPVMYPIFGMAGIALLVALWKWLRLSFVRKPSTKRLRALLDAIRRDDRDGALVAAKRVGGPAGTMLAAGVEHMDEPRELVEEVMYERLLVTRLKLQRLLPFIAICAASAPLLGLLGTVTGIINTFKLITIFGSGDVKVLSGGISEALITTEFGLIVAIPSLLLHAYLSRKARGVTEKMELAAMSFANEIGIRETRRTEARRVEDLERERVRHERLERIRRDDAAAVEVVGPAVGSGEADDAAADVDDEDGVDRKLVGAIDEGEQHS